MANALDIICPLCGAKPGKDCVTRTGRLFTRVGVPGLHIHVARSKEALEAARKPRAKIVTEAETVNTKTGKVLTAADIQELADEAERGYKVQGHWRSTTNGPPMWVQTHDKKVKKGKKKAKKAKSKKKGKK